MRLEKNVTSSGYYYSPLAASGNPGQNNGAPADGMVWMFGTEKPCNLEGRYVTIVADYS